MLYGDLEIVRYFIENKGCRWSWMTLAAAAYIGNGTIVAYLLQKFRDHPEQYRHPDACLYPVFSLALDDDSSLAMLRMLVENGWPYEKDRLEKLVTRGDARGKHAVMDYLQSLD